MRAAAARSAARNGRITMSDGGFMPHPRARPSPPASRKSNAKKNPPAFGAGGFRRRLAGLEVELELCVQAVIGAVGTRLHLAVGMLPFHDEVGLWHRRVDHVDFAGEVLALQRGQ